MTMIHSKARCMAVGAGMLVLSGCGSTVSEGKHGLQSDGSFNLTGAERSESCAEIRGKMRHLANDTVVADIKTSQEVASSVVFGVLFGVAGAATYRMASDAGDAGKRSDRNLAKMAAYNDTLRSKSCPTWDYQAHIRNKKAAISAKHAEKRRKNMELVR